jgi:uncharacterized repeat protein (TIGR03803 family)
MKLIRFLTLAVAICLFAFLPAHAALTLSGLYPFTSATTSGEYPYWPLVQAGDGNFYGVTVQGGASGYGTVFRMTTNGTVTFPVSFNFSNGGYPYGGLALGRDGNLYGTTAYGGTFGYGTVFRMTTNGVLSTLASFNGANGYWPVGTLVQGQDGNFYGTTQNGGSFGVGNVFRMTPAGVLTNLVSFNVVNGGLPNAGLVQGIDGNLYGLTTTNSAGGEGTIFRMTTNGALTTLVSFNVNAGFSLGALVQGADGNFYGTTSDGGAYGNGAVFKMTPDGMFTNLLSFNGSNGADPYGGIRQGLDGNFYGTTAFGGSSGYGTVFAITPDGTLTTLGSIPSAWGYPLAAPAQGVNGNLYGTTAFDGTGSGYGEAYVLTIANQSLQITTPPRSQTAFLGQTVKLSVATLGSLPVSYEWQESSTNLTDAGNISGTSTRVLTFANITAANAGLYSVIVSNSFGSVTSTPALLTVTSSVPVITLQPTNQTVFPGATAAFRVGAAGNFPLYYQWQLNGNNITDSTNIIGTTTTILTIANVSSVNIGTYSVIVSNSLEWVSSTGAVLALSKIMLTNLYSFSGGQDGANPNALVQGANGLFYGTTQNGGTNGYGTIFQIQLTANGAPTNLYSFTGYGDGAFPVAGLVPGADGNFYGTASAGGTGGWGTVFKITPGGTLGSLYSFTGMADGGFPYAELMQGTDGNFYGTTWGGGTQHGWGTVFEITPGGILNSLHSFTGGADGGSPEATLVQGVDGRLYGTTSEGGTGSGTVFAISTNGVLTNLYSFTGGSDGGSPYAGVIQAGDRSLYGTTAYGGQYGNGAIFKITTNGALATLYSFTGGSDGSSPYAALIQASDGNLYGTTAYGGGAYGDGTVFQITTNGALTTLISFNGVNGANPQAPLVEGTDDNLYGVAQNGGPSNNGVIFRLTVPSLVPSLAFRTPILPANGTITLTWNAVVGQTYQLQSVTNLTSTNWCNLGSPILATNAVVTTGDVIVPDSQRFYRVVLSAP